MQLEGEMKLNTRTLAQRAEQKLATLVPSHIFKVTHNNTSGVKINAVIGSQTKEYIGGSSWTSIDMTLDQIARDYIAAKYPEKSDG